MQFLSVQQAEDLALLKISVSAHHGRLQDLEGKQSSNGLIAKNEDHLYCTICLSDN